MIKYLQADPRFTKHYNKSKCGHIFLRIFSTLTCFKLHELVFSNILGARLFKAKLEFVNRLFVFNVLLVCSLFWGVLVIVGAGLISYYKQEERLYSGAFIQSLDCIVLVTLNLIPTILVLRRKDRDYTEEIKDDEGKRYETNEELNFNQDESG